MLLGGLLAAVIAAAPGVEISDLRALPVHDGFNPIARLSPDGRDGAIVSGWHNDSPGADGESRDYLVLLHGREGEEVVGADLVPSLISDQRFGGQLLSAAPHTGEDWKRAIRFARGRVNGAQSTLMILAERDLRKASDPF